MIEGQGSVQSSFQACWCSDTVGLVLLPDYYFSVERQGSSSGLFSYKTIVTLN